MNFTQAHLKEVTPTKEQATVLDKVEGTPIQAYVIAIADKIALENILSTSRIANNRVCVYLPSKQLVEKLIDQG